MKAYLTGSKGFIGGYLRQHLEERGDEVVGTQDDPFDGYDIPIDTEIVYHAGALVRPNESMSRRLQYLEANVVDTCEMLESVKRSAPRARVVLFGSATQDHHDSWYAYTKTMAELCGEAYAKFDRLQVQKMRLFGVTGVGKSGDVVNHFAEQAAKTGRIRHGRLDTSRDIVDVRDAVPAIVETATRAPPGVHYIGRGKAIPISYIARWFEVPLELDESRVRVEDSIHCSPTASVSGRPIEDTLRWVYDSWKGD